MTTAELDRLTYRIIQGAIEIHKALGPGLLESAYRTCISNNFGRPATASIAPTGEASRARSPRSAFGAAIEGCGQLYAPAPLRRSSGAVATRKSDESW